MSTFKKNTLAIALVAAMGFAANASAYDLGTGPTAVPGDDTPQQVATPDVASNATVITLADQIFVTVLASDNIIGRTTGLGLRLRLDNGARWVAGNPTPAMNNPPQLALNPVLAAAGWLVRVAAGNGTNELVVSIVPPDGGTVGIPEGALLTWTGAQVTNAAALQTPGTIITLTSTLFDPVTSAPVLDPPNGTGSVKTTPLLRSVEPRVFGCSVAGRTEPNERIDVGFVADPPPDGSDSREGFSSDGSIGTLANNGTRNFEFHAGFLTFRINPTDTSGFQYLASDDFRTFVTLTDLATLGAFNAGGEIFWATDGTCATPIATQSFTVGTGPAPAGNGIPRNTVMIDFSDVQTGPFAPGGFDVALCLDAGAGNPTRMDPTAVTVAAHHTRNGGTFGSVIANTPCQLEPMQLNGSRVKVETFNDANNAVATGLIRVTNPSTTSGLVTIEAWDDAGVKAPDVSFVLPAGHSAVYNATHLQTGVGPAIQPALTGALGAPTEGRWRFLVTGQFPSMRVVSFARSNEGGALSNMTDYDTNDEQVSPIIFGFPSNRGSDPQ